MEHLDNLSEELKKKIIELEIQGVHPQEILDQINASDPNYNFTIRQLGIFLKKNRDLIIRESSKDNSYPKRIVAHYWDKLPDPRYKKVAEIQKNRRRK